MRIVCDKGGQLMKKGRYYFREEHRQIVHETGQYIQSAEHGSDVCSSLSIKAGVDFS